MAHRALILALGMIAASAAPAANVQEVMVAPAAEPAAMNETPGTRFCLRVEAMTGSRVETIRCWTRMEWAEQGVDVDEEWPKEGVAKIG